VASSVIFAVLAACEEMPGEAAKLKRQSGFIIPEMDRGKPKTAPPEEGGEPIP
jgi:hypothetical protein